MPNQNDRDEDDRGRRGGYGTDLMDRPSVEPVLKPTTPHMYKVLLHNDDFTPFMFVVESLRRHFRKESQEAEMIMLSAHRTGTAVVAVYTRDVAETKIHAAMSEAAKEGHPLSYSMEKD